MLVQSLNYKSVTGSCIGSQTVNTGFLLLMVATIMLLLPCVVQADGLFDFQMKLAQKGNAEAQYKVGEMYETGFGVKQNKKEAAKWITRAAKQGHETAGFKLLYWDIEKRGVNAGNKDKITALKNKAAEGNAQAQYYVGKMYAHGVGVKKDPDIATGWLNKAALVGVTEAEAEMVWVREDQQRAGALARKQKEKQQAELKLKQEREKKLKQEQQRKRKLQEQKQAEAKAKAAAEKKARAEKAAAKEKKAAEEAKKLQLKQQAEQKQREAKKQALLKKRKAEEKKRKAEFESDPCSGKSARFLSTCK